MNLCIYVTCVKVSTRSQMLTFYKYFFPPVPVYMCKWPSTSQFLNRLFIIQLISFLPLKWIVSASQYVQNFLLSYLTQLLPLPIACFLRLSTLSLIPVFFLLFRLNHAGISRCQYPYSFVFFTCRLWSILPFFVFPPSYNDSVQTGLLRYETILPCL